MTESTQRQLSLLTDVMPRIWISKSERPAPNPVLRGSLFGLVQRGTVEALKDFVVYKDKSMTVLYTGVALGQPDLDVWLCLIQKVGQKFMDQDMKTVMLELCPSQFMRETGRTGGDTGRIGRNDRDWLVRSLLRLTGTIVIQSPDTKKGIMGRLVTRAAWNDDQDRLLVEIDNFVGYLFASGYSQMNLTVRKKLMGDDLSLWLQAFISSHKKSREFFYTAETLMARSRSHMVEPRKFKYQVSQKMRRLMLLSVQERGFYNWLWDGNILRVFFTEFQCLHWLDEHPGKKLSPLPKKSVLSADKSNLLL